MFQDLLFIFWTHLKKTLLVAAYISQFNQKILRGLFKYFMVDLLSAGICTQFVRAKCLTTLVHSSASCHNRVVSYAIVSAYICILSSSIAPLWFEILLKIKRRCAIETSLLNPPNHWLSYFSLNYRGPLGCWFSF